MSHHWGYGSHDGECLAPRDTCRQLPGSRSRDVPAAALRSPRPERRWARWRLFLVTLKCTCARAACPALRTLCPSISCFPAGIPLLGEGSDGRCSTGRGGPEDSPVRAPPGWGAAGASVPRWDLRSPVLPPARTVYAVKGWCWCSIIPISRGRVIACIPRTLRLFPLSCFPLSFRTRSLAWALSHRQWRAPVPYWHLLQVRQVRLLSEAS